MNNDDTQKLPQIEYERQADESKGGDAEETRPMTPEEMREFEEDVVEQESDS